MKTLKVWELVKHLEDTKRDKDGELSEIIATMLVNFGEDGKSEDRLVSQADTPLQMVVKVITHYKNKAENMKESCRP